MPRIVVFGATGFTGRLVVAGLRAAGRHPVLAGRDPAKLAALAAGELDTRPADVRDPASVRALVDRGDVLVSTVGPFSRYGEAAVTAAVDAGAHYLDSTGEAGFIRQVFQRFGPDAERAGCALLTAFGYDFVPGNLAGALALDDAGAEARRVAVGYFFTGPARGAASSGTRATAALVATERAHLLAAGRLRTVPFGRQVRQFPYQGQLRPAALVGGSEPFTLPRSAPQLTDVAVFLGWFGRATAALPVLSFLTPVLPLASRLPVVGTRLAERTEAALARTGEGPDEAARARTGSVVVAEVADEVNRTLSSVQLSGVNGYDLTGRLMAWAAGEMADGRVRGTGALGPVDAFGLAGLERGCRAAGLAAD